MGFLPFVRKSEFMAEKIAGLRDQDGISFAVSVIQERRPIMKLGIWLKSLALVGILLGNPAKGFANDNSAHAWQFVVEDESITTASTEYCYAGSIIDPTTGEAVDLYNLCTDNLDLA
jgi:hypothetical protein